MVDGCAYSIVNVRRLSQETAINANVDVIQRLLAKEGIHMLATPVQNRAVSIRCRSCTQISRPPSLKIVRHANYQLSLHLLRHSDKEKTYISWIKNSIRAKTLLVIYERSMKKKAPMTRWIYMHNARTRINML